MLRMLDIRAAHGIDIAALSAAFTLNLDWFTSTCRKILQANTTKGIKTPSQVIVKKV
jgi:hypothetical protein